MQIQPEIELEVLEDGMWDLAKLLEAHMSELCRSIIASSHTIDLYADGQLFHEIVQERSKDGNH